MAHPTPDVIQKYFDAQSSRDFEALIGLFSDDALLKDEGIEWRGARGILEWREKAGSVYQYTTTVNDVRSVRDNEYVANVHLEGNFPGGTVDLEYRFTIDGQRIRRLIID